jgi:two-component system OmpR family response regulator
VSEKLKCIMCVDDEKDVLDILKMCLETVADFEVICCESGEETLACIEKINPDLILLDVMMPDMDGPSTLKAIRQNPAQNDVPVVFLTARVQSAEIEQYLQMGAFSVISKPFNPMTLSTKIAEIYETFHEKHPPNTQKNLQRR